jgi:hypothetical protein
MNFKKPYNQYEGKWISYDGDVSFVIKYLKLWDDSISFVVIKEGNLQYQTWIMENSKAFITKSTHPYRLMKRIFETDMRRVG